MENDHKKVEHSLTLGRDREYFIPEVVFSPLDEEFNTPAVYFPVIIDALNESLDARLNDEVWAQWDRDDPEKAQETENDITTEILDEKTKINEQIAKLDTQQILYEGSFNPTPEEKQAALTKKTEAQRKLREELATIENDEKIKAVANSCKVTYVKIKGDEEEEKPVTRKTGYLRLARYGCQVVRVYGPEKITVWETLEAYLKNKQGELRGIVDNVVEKEIDLHKAEKLIIYGSLDAAVKAMDTEIFKMKEPSRFITLDECKAGAFGYDWQEDAKEGRFYQQREPGSNSYYTSYSNSFTFCGKTFVRTWTLPANINSYSGQQVVKVGRKKQLYREVLTFSGDTEQTIKYWYDDPIVRAVAWTNIINARGEILEVRPNNAAPGTDWVRNYRNYEPKKGRTFYALEPCWGSMVVEYIISYTEFKIFYDFPNLRREYEVIPNRIEQVGCLVTDAKFPNVKKGIPEITGTVYRNEPELNEHTFLPERQDVPHRETILAHRKINEQKATEASTVDIETVPKVAYKLFKKVKFKPFKPSAINFFYTNDRRMISASFTPPEPIFLEMLEDELPKVSFYEKRVKKGGVEHVEEIKFVDMHGNITEEKLEKRK